MTLTIYMDVHIPRVITNGLRQRGVNVITAQEDETATLDDTDLLDRATELGCPLYTHDYDLLAEAHRRQEENVAFARVIFTHQIDSSIGRCIEDLELIANACEPEDMINKVEFIPF